MATRKSSNSQENQTCSESEDAKPLFCESLGVRRPQSWPSLQLMTSCPELVLLRNGNVESCARGRLVQIQESLENATTHLEVLCIPGPVRPSLLLLLLHAAAP